VSHPECSKSDCSETSAVRLMLIIDAIWPEYQLSVFTRQGLIAAMEDEARWMIRTILQMKRLCQILGITYTRMPQSDKARSGQYHSLRETHEN